MAQGKTYADLLLAAQAALHGPVDFAPGEIEASMAEVQRRLAATLAELTATPSAPDLVAFLDTGQRLTHAQQRQLFADPALRARFQALTRQRAVERPAAPGRPPSLLEMPIQVAAASAAEENFERQFPGGTLRISPVGIDQQVYVIITLDDPGIAPRALQLENAEQQRVDLLALPPADAGEAVLVRDLALAEDEALIALLRDPHTSATFLR